MKAATCRRWSGLACWLCVAVVGIQAAQESAVPSGCAAGTFLQFQQADGARTRAEWIPLFDQLDALGMRELVLQWSAHGGTAFVDAAPSFVSGPRPPLSAILDLADTRGVRVWVGLIEDPQFWVAVGRETGRATYLAASRERISALIPALTRAVAGHRSFAGWYITQEIDNVSWLAPDQRQILVAHLRDVSTRLRAAGSPAVPIAISGFSNASMEPAAHAAFWSELLETADIDALFFQDGVGTGRLQLSELTNYAAPLRRALEGQRRRLAIITEVFRQTDAPPINDQPFRAVPAPFDRVERQLAIAHAYSTAGPLTFSAPDYMAAGGGPAAAELFRRYAQWVREKRGTC